MFAVYLELGFEHLLDLRGYDHILFIAGLCAAYSLTRWRELLVLVTAFTIGHSVSLALATLRLVRVDTSLVEFLIPVTIVATAVTNLASLRRTGRARLPRESPAGQPRESPAGQPRESPAGQPREDPAGHGRQRPAEHRVTARPLRYALALSFGLVHGLGFSNFLRIALGDERNLFVPLLSFNIGLELAQIVVAGAVLALGAAVTWAARAVRAAATPDAGQLEAGAAGETGGLRSPATPATRLSQKAWSAAVSLAVGGIAATMAVQRWPW